MSVNNTNDNPPKLGIMGLSALVFGMMVGAGIFNIPQNMAVAAGPVAVTIAWIITAAGMLLLVSTFKILSDRRPDLNAGLYLYARQGFGQFAGFLTAWGYWLCTAFANVAYAVMLNDTIGSLFPSLLQHGWQTFVFGSCLIWIIFLIVVTGLRTASMFNTALTVIKFGCIVFIIVLLVIHVRFDILVDSFMTADRSLPDTADQVRDTMLVTLWCFIGIEGAVMMSGRAKRSRDVGKAGIFGFFSAWMLYVLVSLLSFGLMARARLAGLEDPSVAYLLKAMCGDWAYWLVIASVSISLGGGWVAWSLVCAEVPYTAANNGLFPRCFLKVNRHGIPAFGLVISSVIMELFLMIVMFSDRIYLTALSITGMMILPAYLLTAVFLWKISRFNYEPSGGTGLLRNALGYLRPWKNAGFWTGAMCSLFCCWMIYAGGPVLFMQTSIFYLLGLGFHVKARKERNFPVLTLYEKWGVALLCIIALLSVICLIYTE